jgi:hypothetical protein
MAIAGSYAAIEPSCSFLCLLSAAVLLRELCGCYDEVYPTMPVHATSVSRKRPAPPHQISDKTSFKMAAASNFENVVEACHTILWVSPRFRICQQARDVCTMDSALQPDNAPPRPLIAVTACG